jgi:hypothetical protein
MAQHGPSIAQHGPSMAQHRSRVAQHVASTTQSLAPSLPGHAPSMAQHGAGMALHGPGMPEQLKLRTGARFEEVRSWFFRMGRCQPLDPQNLNEYPLRRSFREKVRSPCTPLPHCPLLCYSYLLPPVAPVPRYPLTLLPCYSITRCSVTPLVVRPCKAPYKAMTLLFPLTQLPRHSVHKAL